MKKLEDLEGMSDSAGKKAVDLEIDRLLEYNSDIWDIISQVMDVVEKNTISATTRNEFKFLFLITLLNCSRQSDVKNIDPTSFELKENVYLGRIVRATVYDTKNGKKRYMYFFPVESKHDPIVVLHHLFTSAAPIVKTCSSNKRGEQKLQLLRDNLVCSYDRFLAKHGTQEIFAIKHGPKSHFGRHLLASYLHRKGLGEFVTPYGNWTAGKDTIASAVRKIYIHGSNEVSDDIFAFLSGFYEPTAVKTFVLRNSQDNPLDVNCALPLSTEDNVRFAYRYWVKCVPMDVLMFVHSYVASKTGISFSISNWGFDTDPKQDTPSAE